MPVCCFLNSCVMWSQGAADVCTCGLLWQPNDFCDAQEALEPLLNLGLAEVRVAVWVQQALLCGQARPVAARAETAGAGTAILSRRDGCINWAHRKPSNLPPPHCGTVSTATCLLSVQDTTGPRLAKPQLQPPPPPSSSSRTHPSPSTWMDPPSSTKSADT